MKPIIKPAELVSLLNKEKFILIDARSGGEGSRKYAKLHLKSAFHINLEFDLAVNNSDPSKGGRHPLPDFYTFAEMIGKAGIMRNSYVIVYDDKNGSNAAARLWWMLRAIGHTKVQVLDGGFDHAIAAGYPSNSEIVDPVATPSFKINNWKLPTASIEEIEIAVKDKNSLVIDVRSHERYHGIIEPIDLVAGHIPGAINIPFTDNLDNNGLFKPPEELKLQYEKALNNRSAENVFVHCGSGVTACHTLLAMDYAGMEIPKLYVGSWSEWSRTNRPIATKEI